MARIRTNYYARQRYSASAAKCAWLAVNYFPAALRHRVYNIKSWRARENKTARKNILCSKTRIGTQRTISNNNLKTIWHLFVYRSHGYRRRYQ